MDEKTTLLISLAAATAANCIPCFEYYYGKAQTSGLAPEDIGEAVDIAYKIKSNINMLMKDRVKKIMGSPLEACPGAGGKCPPTCTLPSDKD
jgi:hypothetical protein